MTEPPEQAAKPKRSATKIPSADTEVIRALDAWLKAKDGAGKQRTTLPPRRAKRGDP